MLEEEMEAKVKMVEMVKKVKMVRMGKRLMKTI